jgi:tRNA A-37 threonylcarbamoyl transferase component Bud32
LRAVETNSGVLLDRMVRTGDCGTWWSAATPNGHRLGLLQLEKRLIATPAARERAAAAVAAVRAVNAAGVLRTTELVVDGGRAWLVIANPPPRTLADVCAGNALAAGEAVALASDVATALRALHAQGLGHGQLAAETVLVDAAGRAGLVEVGLLAALRDTAIDLTADAVAFGGVLRRVAGVAHPADASALCAAADIAEFGDLTGAHRRLGGPYGVPRPGQSIVDGIRLRFGPGVPAPSPVATAVRRRMLGLKAAVAAVAVLLGVGAAAWMLLLMR